MKIGVDIDGPVYDFMAAIRSWMILRGHDPATLTDPVRYEVYEQWGLTRAEFDDECDRAVRAGHLFRGGEPEPGAAAACTDLLDAGHQVHLITARPTWAGQMNVRAITELWLRQHAIPYTALKFSVNKARIKMDVFIDDHLTNYQAVTAAGRACYLLDRPYNQTPDETVLRVGSLAEFATMILGEARLLSIEHNYSGLWRC